MTELVGTGLVKRCECFDTLNAILISRGWKILNVSRPMFLARRSSGSQEGAEWPRRLVSLKDGTAILWSEAGIQSRKCFE